MKVGRNEPCPCGSGQKYKKCCLLGRSTRLAIEDLVTVERRMQAMLANPSSSADDKALYDTFFDPAARGIDAISVADHRRRVITYTAWVMFDVVNDDGTRRVDSLLHGRGLAPGARRYLEMMRETVMRPYEIVGVDPGAALILCNILENDTICVRSTDLSREVSIGDLVAARVVPQGLSGLPEIDGGCLLLKGVTRDALREQLMSVKARMNPGISMTAFLKSSPPLFHRRWSAQPITSPSEAAHPAARAGFAPDERAIDRALDDAEQRLQRHYTGWLDAPQPGLDGLTPRDATASTSVRPRLVEILHDLERQYQTALVHQQPTFDPSWLWDVLDLHREQVDNPDPAHPPPLGHERMEAQIPGLAALARTIADPILRAAGGLVRRAYPREELIQHPAFERYLTDQALPAALLLGSHSIMDKRQSFAAPLEVWCNLEIHRHKVFWVDWKLSWQFGATDPDGTGDMLRLPFPAFAIAFTDRYALGLVERLISRAAESPERRGLLRIVTVYVLESSQRDDGRNVRLVFVCDALDHRGPYIFRRELWIEPDASLEVIIDAPGPGRGPERLPSSTPLQRLLRLIINVILYATSANAVTELREPPLARNGRPSRAGRGHVSSEAVHYLPGKIDITRLRQLQLYVRGGGGDLLHRSMVRGHFRRPNPDWNDQRKRWIEPYVRGPEDAPIVEREYRLKP